MTDKDKSDIRERYSVTVDSGHLESKNVKATTLSDDKLSIFL
jgi:hypothetical protein